MYILNIQTRAELAYHETVKVTLPYIFTKFRIVKSAFNQNRRAKVPSKFISIQHGALERCGREVSTS
jgi:hypothetical protein